MKLDFKHKSGFYNLSSKDISKYGGAAILKLYNGSVSSALQSVYPEHNWDWKCLKHSPRRHWANQDTKIFFDQLASTLAQQVDFG
jgi:hypothetical protein